MPQLRCTCHGECAGPRRRRVCAEPDLDGRCRAEQGQAHPRTMTIAEVRIDTARGRAICRDCMLATLAKLTAAAPAAHPTYEMFEGYPI